MIKEAGTTIERRPAKYESTSEQILNSPASTKWEKRKADAACLSANPDDCLVWCLVEIPASYRTVTKSIRVGCEEGWTDNGDDCTMITEVPAAYKTRSYQKLVSPATTEVTEVPAQYTTRSYRKLVSPSTFEKTEVPAAYKTRSYQKLVSPATTEVIDVPAQYETRSYKKLVSPATTEVTDIPAKYTTRSYKKLISPASTISTDVAAVYASRSFKQLTKDAEAVTVPCGKSSILEGINFESGSAVLEKSSYAEITKLEEMLKEKANITAKLVGHTDSQGSEASNLTLSKNRAKAVYDVLTNSGIDASRLNYEGMGESSPVADNSSADGRRTNRRTEFITYGESSGDEDCDTYENRSYQKLVSPAATISTDVAAQYDSRTYSKLVSPAATTSTEVPAQTRAYSRQVLVKAGGYTDWREIVCDKDITADLISRVQSALMSRGYDVGAAGADNVMGAATKTALVKFQKANGLPVGQLDFETLKALGVK
jgi:outer membrane protein OmpA-like peptidoglycan-associated protein